jgi:hypothetical protein
MNTEKRRVIKKIAVLNKDRCMGLYSISLEICTVNVGLYIGSNWILSAN